MAKIIIEYTEERVTPHKAQQYLSTMGANRRPNQNRIKRYAAAMRRGIWVINGEAIKFNEKGELIDGQNRLHAIIEAGANVSISVMRNVPGDVTGTFDMAGARSLTHWLQIVGEDQASAPTIAASINLLWSYERAHNFKLQAANAPEIDQAFAVLDTHPGLRESAIFGRRIARRVILPASVVSALHYIFSGIDEGDCDFFWETLASGAGLAERDPLLLLRERMIQNTRRNGRMPTNEKAALTIKAWNAYRDGRSMSVLSWRAGGANPEEFPTPK